MRSVASDLRLQRHISIVLDERVRPLPPALADAGVAASNALPFWLYLAANEHCGRQHCGQTARSLELRARFGCPRGRVLGAEHSRLICVVDPGVAL